MLCIDILSLSHTHTHTYLNCRLWFHQLPLLAVLEPRFHAWPFTEWGVVPDIRPSLPTWHWKPKV